VNLLREGLDLPEVSLVCIVDADKAGFLRSETSMIQQMGRAARNVHATVILYADTVTPAMHKAMEETERRRQKQLAYNVEHGITPETIRKAIRQGLELEMRASKTARQAVGRSEDQYTRDELIAMLESQMLEAAENLEFERAAALRDRVKQLRAQAGISGSELAALDTFEAPPPQPKPGTPGTRTSRKPKKIQRQ
jgi:excinuclease ABC subunit B